MGTIVRSVAIVAWVASVAIGTRYIFGDLKVFGDRQYLEYITPYLTLATLIQAGSIFIFAEQAVKLIRARLVAVVLLVAVCGIASSPDIFLSTWWFVVLLLWAWSLATLSLVFKADKTARSVFLAALIAVGSLEAVLALLQFTLQHSLGLSWLGEPVATAATPGVAKVISNGEKLLRPFGTFPHSNVLGGYLAAVFLALLSQKNRLFRAYPLLFQILTGLLGIALFVTYSRSTWIVAILIIFYFLLTEGVKLLAPLAVSIIATAALFAPSLLNRFVFSEQAEQLTIRTQGLSYAWEVYKAHPLGIGLRQFIPVYLSGPVRSLLYSYQPPHNALLLGLTEFGIVGVIPLALAFFRVCLKNASRIGWLIALVVVILAFSDHYLMTLPQGLGILGTYLLLPRLLRGRAT